MVRHTCVRLVGQVAGQLCQQGLVQSGMCKQLAVKLAVGA